MTTRSDIIHRLPCIVCQEHFEVQQSPTEEHHLIHGRYSQHRVSAENTIPLCDGHHQGKFDLSKIALHRSPSAWKWKYGQDHKYLTATNREIERWLSCAS
jgi:hypothetical protein